MFSATSLGLANLSGSLVYRVHSKQVVADDNLICNGSFNWFSASRDERYARYETSHAFRGPGLSEEIGIAKESLRRHCIEKWQEFGLKQPAVPGVGSKSTNRGEHV